MVTWRTRGETVAQTEGIRLRVEFTSGGVPVDLDSFPTVSIIEPNGGVLLAPTTTGVYRVSEGVYGYDFVTGLNTYLGVFRDQWRGTLQGINVIQSFTFVVFNTQLPAINTDQHLHLGDDPGFHYNQTEIMNINLLMKTLRERLNSSGLHRTTDSNMNIIQSSCDIFSPLTMASALANSLSSFNQIPHFTMFTFNDTEIIAQFHDVLVQGAVLLLLSGKALIERGREYSVQDNGISLQIPTVSELLNTEWQTELTNYTEKVKMIKGNMKSSPLGLGSLSLANGGARSQIQRLRLLRERRII